MTREEAEGTTGDGGLTVLDGEADSHTETLPVTSVLGDVLTNLLWETDQGDRSLGARAD
jgi:hypothetical protein